MKVDEQVMSFDKLNRIELLGWLDSLSDRGYRVMHCKSDRPGPYRHTLLVSNEATGFREFILQPTLKAATDRLKATEEFKSWVGVADARRPPRFDPAKLLVSMGPQL